MRLLLAISGLMFFLYGKSQLLMAYDTISVIDNGYCLKLPYAGGLNAPTFSNMDLNFDGKNDIVVYDKLNNSALGQFKCFVNIGNPGETKYEYRPDLNGYFPNIFNWALLYDYNGDGKVDIFASITGGIQVFKNSGDATNGLQFTLVKGLIYSNYNPQGAPSMGNVYTSPVGLPAISDIDNDGDLDILTFSPTGIYIEYHRNMSKELYGHADSLVYELGDQCWGKLSENSCQVNLNQCPSRLMYDSLVYSAGRTLHAGACLMCFDRDGDSDKDLIIGDISCSTVEYCQNDGSIAMAQVSDTTKLFPNYPNKNSTTQIKMNAFPCTYYIDVDDDNVQELIASPNAFGGENINSAWLYKNASSTATVDFQIVKKNFLQDEMIDVGQMSRPVVFDANGDGKKDVLIGSYGVYLNGGRKPRFYLLENIGTVTQPAFSLTDKDYANLSTVLNGSLITAIPAPGDIDNDGDIDLLVVTNGNKISWYENTAGAGNPCNFSNFKYDYFSITFPSSDAIPQLFDFDSDGKLDLMVGTKNGKVYYYQNIGTVSSPSFTLISGSFPNVSLKGDFFTYGLDGFGAPFFYRENTSVKMLGGCVTGQLYLFDVPSSPTSSCVLIDSTANNIKEPTFSMPWMDDINGDGKLDLFVGNSGGGISFYSSNAPDIGVREQILNVANQTLVFPNPSKDYYIVESGNREYELQYIRISDITGRELKAIHTEKLVERIDVSGLSDGVYIMNITLKHHDQVYTITKKVVKQ